MRIAGTTTLQMLHGHLQALQPIIGIKAGNVGASTCPAKRYHQSPFKSQDVAMGRYTLPLTTERVTSYTLTADEEGGPGAARNT